MVLCNQLMRISTTMTCVEFNSKTADFRAILYILKKKFIEVWHYKREWKTERYKSNNPRERRSKATLNKAQELIFRWRILEVRAKLETGYTSGNVRLLMIIDARREVRRPARTVNCTLFVLIDVSPMTNAEPTWRFHILGENTYTASTE